MIVDSQDEQEEEEEDEYQNDEDEEEDEEDDIEIHEFLSRERKLKIIQKIVQLCKETSAAANIVTFIQGWSSHDALVDWIEANPDFKVRLDSSCLHDLLTDLCLQ